MLLTLTSVVPYLLDKGLVSPRSVVEGHVVVSVVERRNRSFLVRIPAEGGVFLKQAKSTEWPGFGTLEREARFYQALQGGAAGRPTTLSTIPRLQRYDPHRQVLALELIPDCETVAARQLRSGEGPGELARLVGTVLAAVHSELVAHLYDGALVNGLPRSPPWMTVLHRTGVGPLRALGAPAAALADALTSMPQLVALLSLLEPHWRPDTLVHGDLRWENLLIVGRPGATELKVVDWELVDVGDSAFDMGTILKEYLVAALVRGPVGTMDLRSMQGSIRAFVTAYLAARGLAWSMEGRSLLARAVAYAGAQLVTAALEYTQVSGRVDDRALQFLILSGAILGQPGWAMRTLFAVG